MNEKEMNHSVLTKRLMMSILICTAGGVLCFIYLLSKTGEIGMALSVFYERILIGQSIGFFGDMRLKSYVRGGLLGLILSIVWSIVFLFEISITWAIAHCFFGIIYGVIADFVASTWSTRASGH